MTNLYPQYLNAIHDRICGICTERTAEGACGLPDDAVCPLETYLVKIVDTVHSVSSDKEPHPTLHHSHSVKSLSLASNDSAQQGGEKMEDYVDALRNMVCAQCPNQTLEGNCPFRQNINCVLNRYFALVVDAIDEVDEQASWPQCC